MKLKILAALIAGTFAIPMVAQAGEVRGTMVIDGDLGVAYSDESEEITQYGSELNIDGEAEIGNLTYFGHMELEVNGDGNASGFDADEVHVGVRGDQFGELRLGDTDNACDMFDPGAEDIWTGGQSISCLGRDDQNISYQNKFGVAEVGVSYSPKDDDDATGEYDQAAVGARFSMGPAKVNLGWEDGVNTSEGNDEDLFSFGVRADFENGFGVNAEGNDDDMWGANAYYTGAGNTFWVSYGDDDTDDGWGGGYRRSHGQIDYIIEYDDPADETLVGMRYRF